MSRDFFLSAPDFGRKTELYAAADLDLSNKETTRDEAPGPVEHEKASPAQIETPPPVEKKESDFDAVAPGELKLSQLAGLDKYMAEYKGVILRSLVNRNEKPKINYPELDSNFDKVLEGLSQDPDLQNATLAEIVNLGSVLKDKIIAIIPPEAQANLEQEPIPDHVKPELIEMVKKFRIDIENYMHDNADKLSPSVAKIIGRFFSLKGREETALESKFTKEALQNSLNVLAELSSAERLNKQLLAKEIIYIDDRSKELASAGLGKAIPNSGRHSGFLESFVNRIENPGETADQVIPEKIITALIRMAKGYGQPDRNVKIDADEFGAGTFKSAGGGSADHTRPGVVETVKVRKNPDASN